MFCLFEKKKTYLLTWAYDSINCCVYTDIIKARDPSEVWKKHKREHPIATYLIELKEI